MVAALTELGCIAAAAAAAAAAHATSRHALGVLQLLCLMVLLLQCMAPCLLHVVGGVGCAPAAFPPAADCIGCAALPAHRLLQCLQQQQAHSRCCLLLCLLHLLLRLLRLLLLCFTL
jgi:hypothetical protein